MDTKERRFFAGGIVALFALVALLGTLAALGCGGGGDNGGGFVTPPLSGKGLAFSPYVDSNGCPRNFGSTVDDTCLKTLLNVVNSHTEWVRTYGSTSGLQNIPRLAKFLNLKVAAGAYVVANADTEIQNLMNNVNIGLVDLAIVGNEAMQAGVPRATLIQYINNAKNLRDAAHANVPVTTCLKGDDVYIPDNAPVLAACDVICDNMYPNFGDPVTTALTNLKNYYTGMAASNQVGGKQLIIGETGWPSGGTGTNSQNFTNDNERDFHNDIVPWATSKGILAFYFESFDEPAKGEAGGEAYFGVWNNNLVLKQGLTP